MDSVFWKLIDWQYGPLDIFVLVMGILFLIIGGILVWFGFLAAKAEISMWPDMPAPPERTHVRVKKKNEIYDWSKEDRPFDWARDG